MAPGLETTVAEFPKSPPNPAIDGGHFERFAGPIIPLPTTGKVCTVNQATGIDTGTDVFTFSGDSPTNGNAYKLSSTVTLPTGPIAGGIVYARDVVGGTCKFAATPGGVAIDITAAGTGTLTITEYAFDRLYVNCIVEDPARSRLVALVHGRTPQAGELNAATGRAVYMVSAPWGHPEGPFTWLNVPATPLIPMGVGGKWNDGNSYMSAAMITGNQMLIAHGGTSVADGVGKVRTGLVTVDLTAATPAITTNLTANAPLSLGTTPYQSVPCGLYERDGRINLRVFVQLADGTVSLVPRHYRNISFTASGWTIHPSMVEYGSYAGATGSDTGYPVGQVMHDGSFVGTYHNDYNLAQINQYSYVGSTVVKSEKAYILTPAASGWDNYQCDNVVLFYHVGNWYAFWGGNTNAGFLAGDANTRAQGSQPGCAKYIYTGTAQDQTGFTPAVNEYPTEWVTAATATVDKVIPTGTVTADLGGGISGNTIDLSVRGKVTIDATPQADLTANPGFKSISGAFPQSANGGGYIIGCFSPSGGTFKMNLRYPVNGTHTHTENTAAAYVQNATSGALNSAVGSQVGAHPAIGISSVNVFILIKGKTI